MKMSAGATSLAAAAMLLGLAATASPAAAATTVLRFGDATCDGGKACFDGAAIDANYGDGAGVDVGYRSVSTATNNTYQSYLKHWRAGYGDLSGVVYGGSTMTGERSEILLKALPGYQLSLLSFDFGTYLRNSATVPISITTLGGQSIFGDRLSTTPGLHSNLAVNSDYFSDGILISWGPDGYNVGLDNIAFDARRIATGAVPEPATWAMLICGFGGVGSILRRRRRTSLPALA